MKYYLRRTRKKIKTKFWLFTCINSQCVLRSKKNVYFNLFPKCQRILGEYESMEGVHRNTALSTN